MKLIPSSFEILDPEDFLRAAKKVERAGRNCYKSEDKITDESAEPFVGMLSKKTHFAMLEFGGDLQVRVVCDRGISHEIVRHRIASYAQESTRYCNYSKNKFGAEVTFIDARPHLPHAVHVRWLASLQDAERAYLAMLENGVSPQMARSVLPNALKTEIVISMNPVAWRNFFYRRTNPAAHPQMIEIARPMLAEFRRLASVLFDDVGQVSE